MSGQYSVLLCSTNTLEVGQLPQKGDRNSLGGPEGKTGQATALQLSGEGLSARYQLTTEAGSTETALTAPWLMWGVEGWGEVAWCPCSLMQGPVDPAGQGSLYRQQWRAREAGWAAALPMTSALGLPSPVVPGSCPWAEAVPTAWASSQ